MKFRPNTGNPWQLSPNWFAFANHPSSYSPSVAERNATAVYHLHHIKPGSGVSRRRYHPGILGFWFSAERGKMLAGDLVLQSRPLPRLPDPRAGPDFTRRVVIILRQMLVEYPSAAARFLPVNFHHPILSERTPARV